MDVVGFVSTLSSLIGLVGTVGSFIKDVIKSTRDRAKFKSECEATRVMLEGLMDVVAKESEGTGPWLRSVCQLAEKGGGFDALTECLEEIQTMLPRPGRFEEFLQRGTWFLDKKDMAEALLRMERVKSLIDIALGMDHM